MRRYYTKEEADKATYTRINELRACADLFPMIKRVIQRFDGKVYNKRFIDAIQNEIGCYCYVYKYNNNHSLQIRPTQHAEYHTILAIYLDRLTDGKRINAEILTEALLDTRIKMLKEAAELEEQMQKVEQVQEQLKQLMTLYKAIVEPLNYTICDNYGIEAHARF